MNNENKNINNFKFNTATTISTYFGIGNVKHAPGTFGSIATFPLFLLLNFILLKLNIKTLPQLALSYGIFLALLTALAFWAVKIYINTNKKEDPSEVVVDEVIGQAIAFIIPTLLTIYYLTYITVELTFTNSFSIIMTIILILSPIIFFRLFDIVKPGLIGYYDNNVSGAKGIIMDDVIAGIYAGLTVSLILSTFLLGISYFL